MVVGAAVCDDSKEPWRWRWHLRQCWRGGWSCSCHETIERLKIRSTTGWSCSARLFLVVVYFLGLGRGDFLYDRSHIINILGCGILSCTFRVCLLSWYRLPIHGKKPRSSTHGCSASLVQSSEPYGPARGSIAMLMRPSECPCDGYDNKDSNLVWPQVKWIKMLGHCVCVVLTRWSRAQHVCFHTTQTCPYSRPSFTGYESWDDV